MENTAPGGHTPHTFTYGSLFIGFSMLPLIVGLGENNRPALIIGGLMLAVGFVFIIIGKMQKKRSLQNLGTLPTDAEK